jgi:hypothetical protein
MASPSFVLVDVHEAIFVFYLHVSVSLPPPVSLSTNNSGLNLDKNNRRRTCPLSRALDEAATTWNV